LRRPITILLSTSEGKPFKTRVAMRNRHGEASEKALAAAD
jgi:hypothetical protein